MGACQSNKTEANKQINKAMGASEEVESKVDKLLFLGPGGSGKSTIYKQLRWLHGDGFSEDDARTIRQHVRCQIIANMKSAIEFYFPQFSQSQRFASIQEQLRAHDEDESLNEPLSNDVIDAIQVVMKHENPLISSIDTLNAVQYLWNNSKKLSNAFTDANIQKHNVVDESSQYFWNDLDRIKHELYIPDDNDILSVRFRTTGMIESRFTINNSTFAVVDVGGQKSERKKWLSVFGGVTAVLFVVGLSSYNEHMYEDLQKNQMEDALELFQFVCEHREFQSTHIILFLNKRDIFLRKIAQFPITDCPAFEDFATAKSDSADPEKECDPDPHDFAQCTKYVAEKFRSLSKNRNDRQMVAHVTCAKDRMNIKHVFHDLQQMIVKQLFQQTSMFM